MDFMYIVIGAIGFVAACFFAPLVWAVRDGEKQARKEREALAARVELQRQFKPRQFPPLTASPLPACGRAPDIPLQLSLETSVKSYPSAMTMWEVHLNTELVHSVFGTYLAALKRRPIATLADIEAVAQRYPQQEWILRLVEPLQTLVYQRHLDGKWNLVRVGSGIFG
jgi:hypothetical protein